MAKQKRPIPKFKLPIIETHCHLDYLKEMELALLLEKCSRANIQKIITIAVDPDNLDKVIEIANVHSEVLCSQGIHPHDAKLWTEEVGAKILANLTNENVVAVGEIGLDFHYNNSPKDTQIEVFRKQLQIAVDQNLPVIIHSRDADEQMSECLKEFAPKLKRKGVIHSFTSGLSLAKLAIDLGFYLGFNGIITFNSAENVREAVEICPLDRILLETDAPFLTPVPYRGSENAPYYLPFIAEKVAEVKKENIDKVLSTTFKNSLDLFQFSI